MDRLIGLWAVAILGLLACGPDGDAAEPSPEPSPPTASAPMRQAPALPDAVYLQMANLSTGWVYRIAEDGRYLVTPHGGVEGQRTPLSKHERGRETVSVHGLARLQKAVNAAGFFSLDDRLEGGPLPQHAPGGEDADRQHLAFTVRGEQGVKTVEVQASLRVPTSLGALEPIYAALALEALGDWANE